MCIPESCIEIKINLKCENNHFKWIFTSFCSGMVRLGLIADYIWNVDIWIHTVKDVREGSGLLQIFFKFSFRIQFYGMKFAIIVAKFYVI